ncbi:MAG: thioredoxin-dependent thiol peroxidase [Leptolyngbyaceae bacterium]|nr:thioredoxin-dependent thiol peroxidase [Leptolyngbyaceae bacterium]
MPLKPGDPAPEFFLPDAQGHKISLSDFQGQWIVLYFYPRDQTPGCTKEACGFRDLYAELQAHNIVVLGVSTDTAQSHGKFITKYQLPFPLLCDLDAQVATLYESYGLKKFMGKEFMGVHRTTFLISPNGIIEKIYRKVKPEAHAAEILAHFNLAQE